MNSNVTCRPLFSLLLIATAMSGVAGVARAGGEVNVYSYRQPTLVQPLFDGFTKQTGIKVNMIFAKKGLIERIYQEDANSPADVLLTVDIGRLAGAVNKGISQGGPLGCAVKEHTGHLSRSGRPLVWPHPARPCGLCLQGPGRAGRHYL